MVEIVMPKNQFLCAAALIPAIIEAWFFSSDRIRQFGSKRPIVPSAASLAT